MNREEYRDLIERHAVAVLDELRADTELAGVVFEGDVKGNPERYVNVYHDTGFYTAHDYTDAPVDVEVTFTVHSIGDSRWQAVWGSGRVTAQLLRFKPTIDGRRCWPITAAGSRPVARDDDASPPKFIAIDRFVLRSTPR